jgi:tetratricopeptide (TPR) repeat protein
MSSKKYAKQNYVFLYRGLSIARDALLEYIVNCLKGFYGPEWWKLGVEPAFRAEDMEKLKLQFQKRFANQEGPSRPGTELYEILDLNYFGNIIEYNWKKVFSQKLNNDRTLLAYMKEIVAYRNPVAHAETGDLRDDDAFRGLDTSDRLLRLIDRNAAEEIENIKTELRRAWIYGEIGLTSFSPDKVGINIEKGFADLEEALHGKHASKRQLHVFEDLKNTLLNNITLSQQGQPGSPFDTDESIIESLQRMSKEYLGIDFATACMVSTSVHKYTPEDLAKKTLRLGQQIDGLNQEIEHLERQLDIQRGIGLEQKQWLLSRIDFKQKLVNGLQNDLEKVQAELTAPVFFSVSRTTEPTIPEEQKFIVQVDIKNLGRKSTKVSYQEGLPSGITLLEGEIEHEVEIEPDSHFTFSYTCACTQSGSHSFYAGRLDYAEKISSWDILKDTVVIAVPGKGPHLEGRRYYQVRPNGIEIVLSLENFGDKHARQLHIDNGIYTKDNVSYIIRHGDEIPALGKLSATCLVPVDDISEIVLPEKTCITYFDNNGKEYVLELSGPFAPLEYIFPEAVGILGRKREIEALERVLKVVSGLAVEGQLFVERRAILLEGVAGIGKTRFTEEIQKLARDNFGFKVHVEDVSNRSPIKRILRGILGLDAGFASGEMAWDRLEKFKLDEDRSSRYRSVLSRFLSSDFDTLAEPEIQDLTTSILLLIRRLCSQQSYLLVFENAHDFPEGVEHSLFQKLVQTAAESPGMRLAICVTYRPNKNLPEQLLGNSIKMARFEKVVLTSLSQPDTAALVNELIPYPILCDELQDFVFEWSRGNPFYVRELLRHMVSSEHGFLERIGDKLFPSANFEKESFTSPEDQISTLLLQRAKEDMGEFFPAVQVLSVVGLDLPYRLLTPLFETNKFFPLPEKDLLETLDRLVRKGILRQSNTDSLEELEYRFEHQLIRDAIYKALRDTVQHTLIRDEVVTAVINNEYQGREIYADREEHYRQAARHLLYSGKTSQFTNRDFLLRAAHIEEVAHNFDRALDYYRCFLECSTGRDNYLEQAQAHIGSAEVMKMQGDWQNGMRELQMAADVIAFETNRNFRQQIKSLSSKIAAERGILYMKTGDFDNADRYLSEARLRYEGPLRSLRRLFLPKEKDFLEDLFGTYLALAEIWYRKLDVQNTVGLSFRVPIFDFHWKFSDAYFARAERIARKYRDFFANNQLVIDVLVYEGEILSLGQPERALKKLLEAVESIRKQPAANQSAAYAMERAYSYLAEIYRGRSELEAATKYYKEARQIQERLGDIYGLAISNGGLADLYMEQERFEDAESYLLEAHKHQSLLHDVERLWKTRYSLTRVYLKARSLEKARSHWLDARALMLERLSGLPVKTVNSIYETLWELARLYYSAGNLEYALPLCLDLQILGANHNRRFEVDQMLGNIYYKLKEPDKAIQALYEGLDSTDDPLRKADMHKLIGDICSSSDAETSRQQAEESYEECVKLFVQNKLEKEALDVYDRLLQYLASQGDSRRLSPLLHSLIELMFQNKKGLGVKFLERAEALYTQYGLFREAGDTFVHLAYKAVQLKDPERETRAMYGSDEPLYDRELTLLKKAEEYYSKCKTMDDEIGGYYGLISVYFRMDLWEEIARCYRKILSACLRSREERALLEELAELHRIYQQPGMDDLVELVKGHETLLETLGEINQLHAKFDPKDLKDVSAEAAKIEALAASESDQFTEEFRFKLLISSAKLLNGLGNRTLEKEDKNEILKQALERYNRIIDECTNANLKGVSFNDSALILESLGSPKEAGDRLIQSIELARVTKDQFAEACSRANWARFLQRQGRPSECATQFELSMGILVSTNRFWDERWQNQDVAPLTASEIARSWFDKKWCADVAAEYGLFLVRSDFEKGRALMHLAETIYVQLKEPVRAEQTRKFREMLEGLSPDSGLLKVKRPEPIQFLRQISSISPLTERKSVRCASCGFSHNAGRNGCPNCGAVTCAHCGSLVDADSEYCESCYSWIGY